MRDATIAEVLGAHVVESEPSAALWHRVALGELKPAEASARLLAERPDASEAERALLEQAERVFAPPTPQQRHERLAALLERRAAAVSAATSTEPDAAVVPLASRRRYRWTVGLLAAAAAITLAVGLVPPRSGPDGEAFVAHYGMKLGKAVDSVRGDQPPPAIPTFALDRKIEIRLVPEAAVEGPIAVVMFVVAADGGARRLVAEPTVYSNGVVEVDTTVAALGLVEGDRALVIAVGRADALPVTWEELVRAEQDGAEGFEVVRREIRVIGAEP